MRNNNIMRPLLRHFFLSLLVLNGCWLGLVNAQPPDVDEMLNAGAASVQDGTNELLGVLQEKYDSLSDNGKFVAGAAVGFIGTRMIVGSAMGAIKVAGAAFITAEVLHHTGVLDQLPSLSEEQSDMFMKMKGTAMRQADNFRVQVRRRLNPNKIRAFAKKERMVAYGLASGAFVGVLL